jgi:NADH-quinone oxidoreductase subunit E
MFHLEPVGKYEIKICTNVSCCLRGAEDLVAHCKKKLGIEIGATTKDGRFTLMEEECLGACGTAPVLMLNNDYHENLTAKGIDSLIESLK